VRTHRARKAGEDSSGLLKWGKNPLPFPFKRRTERLGWEKGIRSAKGFSRAESRTEMLREPVGVWSFTQSRIHCRKLRRIGGWSRKRGHRHDTAFSSHSKKAAAEEGLLFGVSVSAPTDMTTAFAKTRSRKVFENAPSPDWSSALIRVTRPESDTAAPMLFRRPGFPRLDCEEKL